MRTLAIAGACVLGVIVIMAATGIAAGNGRDHSGETVRAGKWADDVCGTVGAWQGQLKDIREELRHNNWAARRSDGYTGDAQEEVVTIHGAVDRAISATQETLQEGLKRAGIPDTSQGAGAAAILRDLGGPDRAQPPGREGPHQAKADARCRGIHVPHSAGHGARRVGSPRASGVQEGSGSRFGGRCRADQP